MLLFYLLTAEYPREVQTLAELRAAHRTPFRPLRQRRPDVPPALARVIERGLAASPAHRYPHAAALLEALEREQIRRDDRDDARQHWRRMAAIVGAGAVVMLAVGSLTSVAFDHTLERDGFTDESWGDWLLWGVRASVAPGFVFVVGWLLSACLRLGRALLLRVSDRAAQFDAAIRRTCGRWTAPPWSW